MKTYGIPILDEWLGPLTGEPDVNTYIYNNCKMQDVAIASFIFFPDFLENNGLVYLKNGNIEELQVAVRHWMDYCNQDTKAVQEMINHVHLYNYFGDCSEMEDSDIDKCMEILCNRVKLSWEAALKHTYPQYNFCVSLYCESDGEPIVTFCQI
jgi:hypothetical protein